MAETARSIDGDPSIYPAKSRLPLNFFLLVFVLNVPFWAIGAVTGLQLLRGVPVAALAFVCPGLAAVSLVYQENKTAGVKALLMRSFNYRRTTATIRAVCRRTRPVAPSGPTGGAR